MNEQIKQAYEALAKAAADVVAEQPVDGALVALGDALTALDKALAAQ